MVQGLSAVRENPDRERDPLGVAVVFNNNARDHALRNAERFGELLAGAARGS